LPGPDEEMLAEARGTKDRLGTIKRLAEKRKGAFNPLRNLDDPSVRGRVFEWMELEEWIEDLKRDGYTEFYGRRSVEGPRKGELARGAKEFGSEGFGKVLKKVYPSGGPDLVAVHPEGKILVGDITAGEWSRGTVPITPGQPHRMPAELRHEAESEHHLVKTKRDAERLYVGLPDEYMDYEVHFQDRYSESQSKVSRRFQVRPRTRSTSRPSRLVRSGESNVARALETAERAGVEVKPSKLPRARVLSGGEHVGSTLVKVQGAGVKFRTLVIGVKAWRVARTVGGVLVKCFIPLTVLDVLLEVSLALWDREREKDAKKRRDKQRALEAVFKEDSKNQAVQKLIQRNIVYNDDVQEKIVKDWDSNKNSQGFVYARLSAIVKVEIYRDIRGIENQSVTTYSVADLDVRPTTWSHEFAMEQIGSEDEVDKTDAEIMDLIKKGFVYPEMLRKFVQRKRIKYTMVPPLVAPYDIVVTKINNLFLDIAFFVAQFSNSGEAMLANFRGFNYRYRWDELFTLTLEFPHPLNASVCEYCLSYLHWAAKLLSQHPLAQEDLEGNLEDPRKGWKRRLWILTSLLEGRGTTYGRNFSFLSGRVKELVKRGEKSDDVFSALEELDRGARSIWYDLERIEANLYKPQYYYLGPGYKLPD
jgi:hypothetical protein